jgi:UBX domain-containing protein 1
VLPCYIVNFKKCPLTLCLSNASQARGEERAAGPSAPSAFRGSGQTLGGDGVESRVIPGVGSSSRTTRSQASGSQPGGQQPEGDLQERFLHLWNDGFSIDDGPLHRFDDPRNRQDLDMIRNGRAPLHLMNVRLDQPVDVKLQQHHEDWHQLPKIYRPFGGEGRRLGSPVPGEGVATAPAAPAATANTGASSASVATPTTQVDDSQPTLTLRIQLPDGTRLPARFNTTQTVGDVYDFIGRASSATQGRPWVLATTFPNKDHTEKDLVLGDVPEFKRGGTAVVKWA